MAGAALVGQRVGQAASRRVAGCIEIPSWASPLGRACQGARGRGRLRLALPRLGARPFSGGPLLCPPPHGGPSPSGRAAGVPTAAKKANGSDSLLNGVSKENLEVVARVVEQAELAVKQWENKVTRFLTPPELADCCAVLARMGDDVGCAAWGGYPQAERCRLTVGRSEMIEALGLGAGGIPPAPVDTGSVAAVSIEGNFMFDPANHRDFLGATLGTGIDRSKVGDILVLGEKGAQVLCDPALVPFFEMSLAQVRSVTVTTSALPLEELKVREPKVDTMRTTEASMRLDALASAGFRMSRGKMSDLIKSGDVRVNWRSGVKSSYVVQQGDVIAVSGLGRLQVGEVSMTKKERYAVELTRFL